jgi:hypothetical protein
MEGPNGLSCSFPLAALSDTRMTLGSSNTGAHIRFADLDILSDTDISFFVPVLSFDHKGPFDWIFSWVRRNAWMWFIKHLPLEGFKASRIIDMELEGNSTSRPWSHTSFSPSSASSGFPNLFDAADPLYRMLIHRGPHKIQNGNFLYFTYHKSEVVT